MSLLLEALRKAEQERRQGQPPSPFEPASAPLPLSRGARPRYRSSAVLALVVVLCAGALWWQPRPAPRPLPPVIPPPAAVIVEVPRTEAMTPVADPAPEDPAEMDLSIAGGPPSLAAMEIPPPRPLARERAPAAPVRTAPPAEVAPPPQPVESTVLSAEPPAPTAAPRPETGRIQLDPAPTLALDAAGAAMAVPRLSQLPDAERARWPALRFDVHVWNADPSRRFVLVGGSRYREGDRFREGPRIVEIVPEGVIAEHEGRLALIPRPG